MPCRFLAGLLFALAVAQVPVLMPFRAAQPVLRYFRQDISEAAWRSWAEARDRAIRSRLEAGEEDSLVNFLLFGTSFTRQPRLDGKGLADPNSVVETIQARIA